MSEMSEVGKGFELVSFSGVGEGPSKGTMVIKKDGQTIELHKLTILRKPTAGDEAAKAAIQGAQWESLAHETGGLLVDKESLIDSLEGALPGSKHEETVRAITVLFKNRFVNALATVLVTEATEVRKREEEREAKRQRLEKREPKTRTDEEKARDLAMIQEKAQRTARWVLEHAKELSEEGKTPDFKGKKIEGTLFPIRVIRDPVTKEVGIYISVGKLTAGAQKAIKDVVRVSEGKIERLVWAVPKKPLAASRELTEAEKEEIMRRRESIALEAEASKQLREAGTPNIIRIWEVSYTSEGKEKRAYLMECCDGDLAEIVEPAKEQDSDTGEWTVPEETQKRVLPMCLQFLMTLEAMHKAGQVYGDVKPANVLVKGTEIRMSDFGFLKKRGGNARLSLGTPGFIAPEMFSLQEASPDADMWAFGILLLYSTTGVTLEIGLEQDIMARLCADDKEVVEKGMADARKYFINLWTVQEKEDKEAVRAEGLEEKELQERIQEIEEDYRKRMDRVEKDNPEELKSALMRNVESIIEFIINFYGPKMASDPIFHLIEKLLGPVDKRPTAQQAHKELYTILAERGIVAADCS